MNGIQKEPVSAFAIYSKKSKRKRKRKTTNNSTDENVPREKKKLNLPNKSSKINQSELISVKNMTARLVNGKIKKRAKKKKIISLRVPKTEYVLESLPNEEFVVDRNSESTGEYDSDGNDNMKMNWTIGHNSNIIENSVDISSENETEEILEHIKTDLMDASNREDEETEDVQEYENSEEKSFDSLTNFNFPDTTQSVDKEEEHENTQNNVDPNILKRKISELSENINGSSVEVATGLFGWMIKPVTAPKFMREYWEKMPLFVKRNVSNYYSALLSTAEIDSILRNNSILFGKHIDVTSYTDGVRETHNQTGRAQPHVVWDYYANGCSVRFLNPQAFVKKILALDTTLQDYFGCFVGSNVYLTPPDSQGFAPHYDDIEAFVLQIEGKKQWKVYKPRNKHEQLDRYSSPNFSQEEIGKPMLDVVLEAGDMLYFPRGFIHQGSTVPGEHSLHITVSAYQRTAWIDLLEKVVPMALQRAAAEKTKYRQGLPIGYLQQLGRGIHSSPKKEARKRFIKKAKELVIGLADHLDDLEKAVDQLGAQFMHDALPPVLTPDELKRSVFGDGVFMKANGVLSEHKALSPTSKVKLLRANVCRVVEEDGELHLYYTVDNSLEYHAEDPQFLLLSQETLPLVQHLILQYPEFVAIDDLPYPNSNEDEKFQAVSDLWERGLLLTDRPLEQMERENSD